MELLLEAASMENIKQAEVVVVPAARAQMELLLSEDPAELEFQILIPDQQFFTVVVVVVEKECHLDLQEQGALAVAVMVAKLEMEVALRQILVVVAVELVANMLVAQELPELLLSDMQCQRFQSRRLLVDYQDLLEVLIH